MTDTTALLGVDASEDHNRTLSREITNLVVGHAQTQLLPRAAQQPPEAGASTPKATDAD